jgi:hypothetical protein
MPGFTSLVLVVATAAIGLGLATVAASLEPPAVWSPRDAAGRGQLKMPSRTAPEVHFGSPATAVTRASARHGHRFITSTGTEFPRVSAAGPWISPLYPQNGVTLWDRVRVSSQKDRRAFLMGAAIQIHAPALAAEASTWRD